MYCDSHHADGPARVWNGDRARRETAGPFLWWQRTSLRHRIGAERGTLSGPGLRSDWHPRKGNKSCSIISLCAAALERAGITARILRSPKSIAGEGCSHSVKISQRRLPDALRVLERTGLTPKRIFITAGDGSYQEVEL